MKDTTWETAKETRKDTTTVVVMSLALVAFFAIVDAAVQGLIALIQSNGEKFAILQLVEKNFAKRSFFILHNLENIEGMIING